MMRFVFPALALSFFLMTPALAGFEWVPPMRNPAPAPQKAAPVEAPVMNMEGHAFPAPSVASMPLTGHSNNMPVSILPNKKVIQSTKPKNLSGKKLVIDPYPLRNNLSPASEISMTEVYKAMNEESGKLHPVRLGNGLTTGAKKKTPVIPKAVRTASIAHKTFLTPTGAVGMTPMIGAEPAPLPGVAFPASPAASAKTYTEAVGFGRDLPLALALSQVIPSEFTHSFAKNVDAGVGVSWEGGKPWDQVLNDMLRPQDLTATIQDNQVIIQPMAKL